MALIGMDRLVLKGKIWLLSIGLLLIILHSFYYAPACIVALGVYVLHRCFFGNFGRAHEMSADCCGPGRAEASETRWTGGTRASENKRADRNGFL